MARGGYRPGAGRPKGATTRKTRTAEDRVAQAEKTLQSGALETRRFETALDFAIHVINDPDAAVDSKIRLAIAAMPFQHPKLEASSPGKKERQASAAKAAAQGRFAPPAPPKLVVDNR